MTASIPVALLPQYAATTSTLCTCLKVTRADAVSFGFSSLDVPLVVDGLTYEPGFEASDIVSTAMLSVDNLELTILPDAPGGAVNREDLLAGLWDNATFEVFEVNYKAPADGVNVLKRGTSGEVQVRRGSFVVELRGLTQQLQQPVGLVTQKTCRANFCDFPAARTNAPCRLDAADWTVTGTITAVTNNRVFRDSARTEGDDEFTEGLITFVDGLNAGLRQKVKDYAADGTITLSLPMPFEVQPGDAYSMLTGCRKRHDLDCRDRFDNILNFQGEPHLGGIDSLTSPPEVIG